MKKKKIEYRTQICVVPTEKGESIEEMLRRLTANHEPIPNNVPPIYTPKEEGVLGDYDIRHDRFDTAYMAADKFAASQQAKSANKGEGIDSQETEKGKE